MGSILSIKRIYLTTFNQSVIWSNFFPHGCRPKKTLSFVFLSVFSFLLLLGLLVYWLFKETSDFWIVSVLLGRFAGNNCGWFLENLLCTSDGHFVPWFFLTLRSGFPFGDLRNTFLHKLPEKSIIVRVDTSSSQLSWTGTRASTTCHKTLRLTWSQDTVDHPISGIRLAGPHKVTHELGLHIFRSAVRTTYPPSGIKFTLVSEVREDCWHCATVWYPSLLSRMNI